MDNGLTLLEAVNTERTQKVQGYLQIRRGAILGPAGRFAEALTATEAGLHFLPPEPTSAHVSAYMNLSESFMTSKGKQTTL